MELFFTILLWILVLGLSFLTGVSLTEKDNKSAPVYFALSVLCTFLSFGFFYQHIKRGPEALDVYRGKTELVINGKLDTLSNFIPTDSTVVFKEK